MADVIPNYELERQRIQLEIGQAKLSIQSQEYRIAQLLDEKSRIEVNITATHQSVAELEKQLSKVKKD